jgi:hypothetical protein
MASTSGSLLLSSSGVRSDRAFVLGLIGALAMACDESTGGVDPPLVETISFSTSDLATAVTGATIRIQGTSDEISQESVDRIAARVVARSWPALVPVASTRATRSLTGGGQTDNGGQRPPGYGEIRVEVDSTLLESAWLAVSLSDVPLGYTWQDEGNLFLFSDGMRGVRISPDHAPVVASVLACEKDPALVIVYVSFSEPVLAAAGLVTLSYGASGVSCAAGPETKGDVRFMCPGPLGGEFTVSVTGSIVSESSGLSMTTGLLASRGMQVESRHDGCRVYKPLMVDASPTVLP